MLWLKLIHVSKRGHWLISTIWTSLSTVPRQAIKYNHSFTHLASHNNLIGSKCSIYITRIPVVTAGSPDIHWWWYKVFHCGKVFQTKSNKDPDLGMVISRSMYDPQSRTVPRTGSLSTCSIHSKPFLKPTIIFTTNPMQKDEFLSGEFY